VCAVLGRKTDKLTYLVFERKELIAAFAMRDDARHWIEECGNQAMRLRHTQELNSPRFKVAPGKKNPQRRRAAGRKR